MLKKVIKYTDFEGNEQVETAYFHLSKVELLEMEAGTEGGMEEYIKRIIDSKNNAEIVSIFKSIILKAYGQKSEDGKRFVKNAFMEEEFSQSLAFEELFMEIATDANKATAFINGVLPK